MQQSAALLFIKHATLKMTKLRFFSIQKMRKKALKHYFRRFFFTFFNCKFSPEFIFVSNSFLKKK